MNWFEASPAILLTIGLLVFLGLPLLWLLGVRNIALFALSPLVSITMLSISAIIFPIIGVSWNLLPVLLSALTVTALAFAIRLLILVRTRDSFEPIWPNPKPKHQKAFWAATGVAFSILLVQFILTVGVPENFAQEADNIFHLNMTMAIIENNNASSLMVTKLLLGEGSASFYPAALHGVSALISLTTAVSIPVAQNITLLVLTALVWPFGIIWFTQILFGESRITLFAGPLSAAFTGYPLMILGYAGVLPYFMAIAFIPASIATITILLRTFLLGKPSFRIWIVLALILPALIFSHPSSVHSVALICLPLVISTVFRLIRDGSRNVKFLWSIVGLIAGSGIAFLWVVIVPTGRRNEFHGIVTSLGQLALQTYNTTLISILVVLLVMIGVVVLLWVKKFNLPTNLRKQWIVVSYVLISAIYLLSATTSRNPIRDFFAGPWYANPPRIYALTVLVAIPIAALGLHMLLKWLSKSVTVIETKPRAVLVGVLGLVILATQGLGVPAQIQRASPIFQERGEVNGWLQLSQDERDLIQELPNLVPADTTLTGSHYTGTSYTYMLTGIHVMNPQYTWQPLRGSDRNLIRLHLNELHTNPEVCPALDRLNIEYVLDFGPFPGSPDDAQAEYYVGLENLVSVGAAKEVFAIGDARLLKISGCE